VLQEPPQVNQQFAGQGHNAHFAGTRAPAPEADLIPLDSAGSEADKGATWCTSPQIGCR
jgi:hypothetical protein